MTNHRALARPRWKRRTFFDEVKKEILYLKELQPLVLGKIALLIPKLFPQTMSVF